MHMALGFENIPLFAHYSFFSKSNNLVTRVLETHLAKGHAFSSKKQFHINKVICNCTDTVSSGSSWNGDECSDQTQSEFSPHIWSQHIWAGWCMSSCLTCLGSAVGALVLRPKTSTYSTLNPVSPPFMSIFTQRLFCLWRPLNSLFWTVHHS